jgi:hypothetical protein
MNLVLNLHGLLFVQILNYILGPGEEYEGSWHIEGLVIDSLLSPSVNLTSLFINQTSRINALWPQYSIIMTLIKGFLTTASA